MGIKLSTRQNKCIVLSGSVDWLVPCLVYNIFTLAEMLSVFDISQKGLWPPSTTLIRCVTLCLISVLILADERWNEAS